MQAAGKDSKTTRVSLPRDVVNKEAKSRGLTFEEFIDTYKVEWLYDGFSGLYARFVPIKE